ncbi:MAG: class I SAM-dependent methyltransferase [Bacillota bacterium]
MRADTIPSDEEIIEINLRYYRERVETELVVQQQYQEENEHEDSEADLLFEEFNARCPKDGILIDIGCGQGHYVPWMKEMGFTGYLGIDPSEAMLGLARLQNPETEFRVGNVLTLTETAPGPYAGFLCCFALPFIPRAYVPRALANIRSVLRDGSYGIFAVAYGDGERWSEIVAEGEGLRPFVTEWDAELLDPHLCTAGFEMVQTYLDRDRFLWMLVRAE